MIGHVANETERIRVGAGGSCSEPCPLKVAETFRVLEALHPERIDLGIGGPRATSASGYMNISRPAQIKFAFRW